MQLLEIIKSHRSSLRALVRSASRCVVVADAQAPGQPVILVNEGFTRLTGYPEDYAIGRNCRFLQGADTDPGTVADIRKAISEGRSIHRTILNYRRNGEAFWNDLTIDPLVNDDGVVTHFISFQHDATAEKRALQKLADAEEQLANVFEHLPGYVFRRVMYPDFRICYSFISPSIFRILGLPGDTDWSGDELIEHMHADDRAGFRESIIRSGLTLSPLRSEFRIIPYPGKEHWFRSDSRARAAADGMVVWEGLAVDITAEKAAEVRLSHLTSHDLLTGLANRSLFQTILQGIVTAAKSGDQLALFVVDLEDFQSLNDEYGQAAGDLALQNVATSLEACAAKYKGHAARTGGDEFAVVVPSLPTDIGVAEAAEAIYRAVCGSVAGTAEPPGLDARVGAVEITAFNEALQRSSKDWVIELTKRADLALVEAKKPGGRAWATYSAAWDDRSHRSELRRSLQIAIADRQFELHYQPQFDLSSGDIVAAEALLRWRHPELGLQRPDLFIPYAEASGLIVRIGAWVVEEAMRQAQAWALQGLNPPKIAINVSGVQLRGLDFLDIVQRALCETGAAASNFEFELTESTLVEASTEVQQQLSELRQLGFGLAIDDFGTGHASFKYLRDFPVDKIKIDQLFVRHLVVDSSDASIIRSMIALARSLKLGIVAEGIETSMQRDFLLTEGCKVGQGYLFSRPLTSEGFMRLLQSRSPVRAMG